VRLFASALIGILTLTFLPTTQAATWPPDLSAWINRNKGLMTMKPINGCPSPTVFLGGTCAFPTSECKRRYGANAISGQNGQCTCREKYEWNATKTSCVEVETRRQRKAFLHRAARKRVRQLEAVGS
jgi:hypothetical protein